MNKRNFIVVILVFFSKIVKCENRKVRLYLFFNNSLYRYFSEKNAEYNKFKYIDDTKELSTDYKMEDNILNLEEIDEKIKNKTIVSKNENKDIYDNNKTIDFNNCKITSLRLLTDQEKKSFNFRFDEKLKKNFYRYKIEDSKDKIKIPEGIDFVYIFIEDFSNIDLFKQGTIGHLYLRNDNNYPKKEDFMNITDIIKIGDLYDNLKYIEKCDYDENNQLLELLNNKLLNDDKYNKLEFNFNNLTKNGGEKFKIEDLKKMGGFISYIWLYDAEYDYLNLKNQKNPKNDKMYLTCDIKFKRKVKIIFNIPKNTELDLGLSMKQEAEIEFDSFNQKSIEKGLKEAINEIFNTKARLDDKHCFQLSFWQGGEGIWPEKYEVEEENGNKICTILEKSDDNYIDISQRDNLTFKIYLKPGSEILKGIHVKLYFKPVDGKFVSNELEKMPKNTNIIGDAYEPACVFLNKGENYIEQIKNILKEGYFNKQKISLDEDCYKLCLRIYDKDNKEQFIGLTDNSQLTDDVPMIFVFFNDNANGKYMKDNEGASDPIYYGKDDERTKTNKPFDENYEYDYNYSYQPESGNFENYYKHFSKSNSQVQYIKKDGNSGDGNSGDGNSGDGNLIQTSITTPNEEVNKVIKKDTLCCAKCVGYCCCCCNNNNKIKRYNSI